MTMDNLDTAPVPSETAIIYDDLCKEVIFGHNNRQRYTVYEHKSITALYLRWIDKHWIADITFGWLSFAFGLYATVTAVLGLFVFHTADLIMLTLPIVALFAAWMSFRSALLRKNHARLTEAYAWQKAIQFEPREVWKINYLPEAGNRAILINALLGARFIERILSEATTMPVNNNGTDAKVSSLIQNIYDSKEGDIHPYLIEQVNQMCDTTFKYHDMYRGLIELHFMLLESAKTPSSKLG